MTGPVIDRVLLLAANVILAVSGWLGRHEEIGCAPSFDGDE